MDPGSSPGRRRINPHIDGIPSPSHTLRSFSASRRQRPTLRRPWPGDDRASPARHRADEQSRDAARRVHAARDQICGQTLRPNRISAAYISAGRVIAARHTSKSDRDAAPTLASRRPVRTSRDSAEATSAAAKSLTHGSCWTLDMKASTAALAGSLTRIGIMTLASRYQLKDCRSRRADPESRPK